MGLQSWKGLSICLRGRNLLLKSTKSIYADRMTPGHRFGPVPGGFQRKGKVCFRGSFSEFRVGHSGLDRTTAVLHLIASTCEA